MTKYIRILLAFAFALMFSAGVQAQTVRPGFLHSNPAAAYRPSLDLNFVNNFLDPSVTFTRASDATYRSTDGVRMTAAVNVPRFDHDANGNPLGLLIEESRTNFLLNSAAPVTQTTGSLGIGTYTLWVEGTGSATMSAGSGAGCGTSAATVNTPVTFTITGAGTCTVTVAGSVTVFQLENGTFPTSLIITTAATGTRSPDVVSVDTLTQWFNVEEGTLFVEFDLLTAAATTNERLMANIGLNGPNRIACSILSNETKPRGQVRAAAFDSYGPAFGSLKTAGSKVALAWRTNDARFAVDGELNIPDFDVTVPVGLTALHLGRRDASAYLNGHLRHVAYYPRRMPDGVLQAITGQR